MFERDKFDWDIKLEVPGYSGNGGDGLYHHKISNYWTPDEETQYAIGLAARAEVYLALGRPKNTDGSPMQIIPVSVERV